MKIGLQTWGTDGDFFPFLALAEGLVQAGHQVSLVYTSIDNKDYSNHPNAAEITLSKANADVAISTNPYALNVRPGSFAEYTKLLETYFEPHTEVMYEASEKLCRSCDLVIGHAVCHTLLTASEKYGCPRVSLVLTPIVVKSKFTSPAKLNLGAVFNNFLWSVGGKLSTAKWFKAGKEIHAKNGLKPVKSLQKELFTSPFKTLVASSPSLTPSQPDWNKTVSTVGFLNLKPHKKSTQLPTELRAFLDSGEAPIYMTFGSCMQYNEEASSKLLLETAIKLQKRVIIQSEFELDAIEKHPNLFQISSVPHSLIFPSCKLIVHHGGAGTTQAALLAGKPSVVIPHGFDQMYWAEHLNKQKLAGKTLLRKGLTASELANEIENVLSNTFATQKAEQIGMEMRSENGVQTAVDIISKLNVNGS